VIVFDVEIVDHPQQEGNGMTKKPAMAHPGEMLAETFLDRVGFSQFRLARDLSVSVQRINEILHPNVQSARALHCS
jgi:plasmid maintenance system antidote protein VapI